MASTSGLSRSPDSMQIRLADPGRQHGEIGRGAGIRLRRRRHQEFQPAALDRGEDIPGRHLGADPAQRLRLGPFDAEDDRHLRRST